MGFLSITSEAERIAQKIVLCNPIHFTVSVFINDDKTVLHHDFKNWLESIAPFNPSSQIYHHNLTAVDIADAHLKRQIIGSDLVVTFT